MLFCFCFGDAAVATTMGGRVVVVVVVGSSTSFCMRVCEEAGDVMVLLLVGVRIGACFTVVAAVDDVAILWWECSAALDDDVEIGARKGRRDASSLTGCVVEAGGGGATGSNAAEEAADEDDSDKTRSVLSVGSLPFPPSARSAATVEGGVDVSCLGGLWLTERC